MRRTLARAKLRRFRELFVFHTGRRNQLEDGIAEKICVLAIVEPKAHFVQIGWQMLRADFMPRPHDAAPQEREAIIPV